MNKGTITIELPILDDVDQMEVVNTFNEKQLWYVCAIAKAFEKSQQELQRKDNEIKQLQEDIVNHIKIASEYKEQMIIKDNNWNELKEWLNYSIKKINEKLKNDNEEIIVKDGIIMNMNGYQILRLKTFRTKMKEVLDKIKELENSESDE